MKNNLLQRFHFNLPLRSLSVEINLSTKKSHFRTILSGGLNTKNRPFDFYKCLINIYLKITSLTFGYFNRIFIYIFIFMVRM